MVDLEVYVPGGFFFGAAVQIVAFLWFLSIPVLMLVIALQLRTLNREVRSLDRGTTPPPGGPGSY